MEKITNHEKSEVLVFAEANKGHITTMAAELLATARKLASQLNGVSSAIVIGSGISGIANEAIAYGAEKVYLIDNVVLTEYNPESYTEAISRACQMIAPAILLLGHTAIGRDIAPRIAFRLKCYPCMDSLKLEIEPAGNSLLQTRMAYSGKAQAVISAGSARPQVATVRPVVISPLSPDGGRKGDVLNLNLALDSTLIKSRLVSTVMGETSEGKLEEAEIVVAGGGGIGGANGFGLLKELAEVLNGAVGATRVPCDEGWIATSYEIGLTGKTVKPKLYFAIGISGAPQHVVGCSGAKCIIAINKDRDASIFKVSDFGVVADYRNFVPALVTALRRAKADQTH